MYSDVAFIFRSEAPTVLLTTLELSAMLLLGPASCGYDGTGVAMRIMYIQRRNIHISFRGTYCATNDARIICCCWTCILQYDGAGVAAISTVSGSIGTMGHPGTKWSASGEEVQTNR